MKLYDQAAQRVDTTPELEHYRTLLLDVNWTEGDEHFEWIANAPVAEIIDWAAEIDANCYPEKLDADINAGQIQYG